MFEEFILFLGIHHEERCKKGRDPDDCLSWDDWFIMNILFLVNALLS
jgi:hypothetical protein